MKDMPRVIHVHVYEDYLPHFEDQGKVWRVSDHKPPVDIDCHTTPWVDKALVDDLMKAIDRRSSKSWLCVICGGDFPDHEDGCPVSAIAAIQGEGE